MPTGIYIRTEKNKHSEETKAYLKMINTGNLNPMYGKKTSTKQKAVVSKLMKGNKHHAGFPSWNKGLKISGMSGYKQPESMKNNLSAKFKGRKAPWMEGENHFRYVKDRTKLVVSEKKHLDGRYREWMRAIKNRDNWECKIKDENCSSRLETHHIFRWVNFPKLRYEVNNGITLCHFHHPRKINDEMRLVPLFKELASQAQ